MKNYNPYDLLELVVNGHNIYGRPFEFDSEIVTSDMKNDKDQYVKPVKIATTCPDCGSGLIFGVNLADPPFPVLNFDCTECNVGPPALEDPFINPLDIGRVKLSDIDSTIHDIKEKSDIPESAVADRDDELVKILESLPEVFDDDEDEELKMPSKVRKKPKKTPKEAKGETTIENKTDNESVVIEKTISFDDSELTEE